MKILDRLPLLPISQAIRFGQRHVRLHRDSMVVWLSVALRGEDSPQRISAPFPALLDSGNNSTVYLHEHHLVHWAGFQRAMLGPLRNRRINDMDIPFHEADVWLHPNTPGTHERDARRSPFRMRFKHGIAVGPPVANQSIFPRLPLLGFPALRENGLDFWFDSKTGQFTVRTVDWRSRLIRLLCRSF